MNNSVYSSPNLKMQMRLETKALMHEQTCLWCIVAGSGYLCCAMGANNEDGFGSGVKQVQAVRRCQHSLLRDECAATDMTISIFEGRSHRNKVWVDFTSHIRLENRHNRALRLWFGLPLDDIRGDLNDHELILVDSCIEENGRPVGKQPKRRNR